MLGACKTVSGPVKDTTCVFPFEYRMRTYRKCIVADDEGRFWCPTYVDNKGYLVGDNWGFCEDSCTGGFSYLLISSLL